jgi:hypothetical protein
VCENKELRRIIGIKTKEEALGWRKLPSDEFYNLHSSPNIIRMIKSRMMR